MQMFALLQICGEIQIKGLITFPVQLQHKCFEVLTFSSHLSVYFHAKFVFLVSLMSTSV